jgi:hypothetical protein
LGNSFFQLSVLDGESFVLADDLLDVELEWLVCRHRLLKTAGMLLPLSSAGRVHPYKVQDEQLALSIGNMSPGLVERYSCDREVPLKSSTFSLVILSPCTGKVSDFEPLHWKSQ